MTASAEEIFDNLRKAHPNDSILVYRYTAPGGCGTYSGDQLLHINLGGDVWLEAYKLKESSGSNLDKDEIKVKAFPFVFDTKGITDSAKRRDSLKSSLSKVFPNHNVTVFIFKSSWSRKNRSSGAVSFQNEYGSDVDIVLS